MTPFVSWAIVAIVVGSAIAVTLALLAISDAEKRQRDLASRGICSVCGHRLHRGWDETYPDRCSWCGAEILPSLRRRDL